jgi:polyisoprenyl-phosphate glycosyltransferase
MNPNAEISIVVPVINEGKNLPLLLEKVRSALSEVGATAELIVVDDGSSDDTWDVVRKHALAAPDPALSVYGLRLSRNFGKENAICAGLDCASGRAVVVMDGDLQHPPDLLREMIRIWRAGEADIVEAVRADNDQAGLLRHHQNRLFYALFRRATGVELDGATDFKLFDRRVLAAWAGMPERTLFLRGMTAWLGFRRRSIPFVVPQRIHGTSKWSFLRLLAYASDAITSFSVLPLRLVALLGGVFLAFAAVFSIYALVFKILGYAFTGFTTVIILLLVTGGCVMISLGLIGEYIGRIYSEVKARPRYVVAETTAVEAGSPPNSPDSDGGAGKPGPRRA